MRKTAYDIGISLISVHQIAKSERTRSCLAWSKLTTYGTTGSGLQSPHHLRHRRASTKSAGGHSLGPNLHQRKYTVVFADEGVKIVQDVQRRGILDAVALT